MLVAVASKYGATSEIAQAGGDALGGRDIEVTVAPIDQVTTVELRCCRSRERGLRGHWLKSANEFVEAGPPQDRTRNGSVQVVIGAGPLGLAVARELSRREEPSRIVTRGGRADAPADAEVVSADVSDPDQARRVFEGASVVYRSRPRKWCKRPLDSSAVTTL